MGLFLRLYQHSEVLRTGRFGLLVGGCSCAGMQDNVWEKKLCLYNAGVGRAQSSDCTVSVIMCIIDESVLSPFHVTLPPCSSSLSTFPPFISQPPPPSSPPIPRQSGYQSGYSGYGAPAAAAAPAAQPAAAAGAYAGYGQAGYGQQYGQVREAIWSVHCHYMRGYEMDREPQWGDDSARLSRWCPQRTSHCHCHPGSGAVSTLLARCMVHVLRNLPACMHHAMCKMPPSSLWPEVQEGMRGLA